MRENRRRVYRLLTTAQNDRIMVLHEQGVLHKYIAERLNVTSSTISNVIRRRKEGRDGGV